MGTYDCLLKRFPVAVLVQYGFISLSGLICRRQAAVCVLFHRRADYRPRLHYMGYYHISRWVSRTDALNFEPIEKTA